MAIDGQYSGPERSFHDDRARDKIIGGNFFLAILMKIVYFCIFSVPIRRVFFV